MAKSFQKQMAVSFCGWNLCPLSHDDAVQIVRTAATVKLGEGNPTVSLRMSQNNLQTSLRNDRVNGPVSASIHRIRESRLQTSTWYCSKHHQT